MRVLTTLDFNVIHMYMWIENLTWNLCDDLHTNCKIYMSIRIYFPCLKDCKLKSFVFLKCNFEAILAHFIFFVISVHAVAMTVLSMETIYCYQ